MTSIRALLVLLLLGLVVASAGWSQSCNTLIPPPHWASPPTLSSNPRVAPPSQPPPFNCISRPADSVTGIVAAYSTRQLLSSYSGPAIRVRRSFDNAWQDIGFASGELDTTALTTFVGGGEGYVVTIYDQSGHGNHLTVGSGLNPGKIVTAGTVNRTNGKPALYFDATGETYANQSITPNITGNTAEVFIVWSTTNSADSWARPLSLSDGTNYDWASLSSFSLSSQNNQSTAFARNYSNAILSQSNNTLVRQYGVFGPFTQMYTDGTNTSNGNVYGNFSISHIAVGGQYYSGTVYPVATTPVGGYWAECVVTNTNQGDYTTFFNNQASYWGTP